MKLQNLTTRAKVLIVAIVSAALSMQVDKVKDQVMPFIAMHPKLVGLANGIFLLVALLQKPGVEPVVEELLGLNAPKKDA